jgi:RNA polymerase-binding protein DksA
MAPPQYREHEKSHSNTGGPMAKSTRPLTAPPLQRLLDTLARREEELRAKIAERREVLERPTPAGEPPGDDADLAFARTCASIDRDLIDRCLTEIGEIEETRVRIAEGTFGVCPGCGSDIGWERLQANPVARRCTHCQALHEKHFSRAP